MLDFRKKRDTPPITRLLKLIILLLCILIIGGGLLIFNSYTKNKENQNINASDNESILSQNPNNNEKEDAATASPVTEETDQPVIEETEPPKDTATPKPKKTPKPKNSIKIAIDAGHQAQGDSSTEPDGPGSGNYKAKVAGGATGISSSVPEYQLNLNVAKKLKKELISRGYDVYMIRTSSNVNISNIERAKAANKSGADIYIRLHADGSDNSGAKGASALYPTTSNPYVGYLSKKSEKLSQCILNEYCKKTGINNRGLSPRDDLTGTNWSKIPVTLIEMGFLSNPSEDEKMQDPSFQTIMAKGIADGIDLYYK